MLQYRGCERCDICTGSKTPANLAPLSRPFPAAEINSLSTISCCYADVHLTMQAVLLTWSCRDSLYLFWIAPDLLASIFSKAFVNATLRVWTASYPLSIVLSSGRTTLGHARSRQCKVLPCHQEHSCLPHNAEDSSSSAGC